LAAEVETWLQHRPPLPPAAAEEALGVKGRRAIDRAIELAILLVERTGPVPQAAGRRWLERCARPLSSEELAGAVEHLRELEAVVRISAHTATAWRALRGEVATQLRTAVALAAQQAEWLEGGA
jgi:hypothetical protein